MRRRQGSAPEEDPELRHISRAALFLVAVFLLREVVWHGYYRTLNTERDPSVGDVPAHQHAVVRPLVLLHAYNDKPVLCIGCTRGIGRGAALAVAEQGASVTVVGRRRRWSGCCPPDDGACSRAVVRVNCVRHV